MLGGAALIEIAGLVPHAGAMVLLQRVERWDAHSVLCQTRSHLDPANPLRYGDRLASVCGIEYGLQAAALHGGLLAGRTQPAGYVASLRGVTLAVDRLDDAALGTMQVEARLEAQESFGMVYGFELRAESGTALVLGRASIALPR